MKTVIFSLLPLALNASIAHAASDSPSSSTAQTDALVFLWLVALSFGIKLALVFCFSRRCQKLASISNAQKREIADLKSKGHR